MLINPDYSPTPKGSLWEKFICLQGVTKMVAGKFRSFNPTPKFELIHDLLSLNKNNT